MGVCFILTGSFFGADISAWMTANMLMFNQNNKEIIIFKPKHQLEASDKIQLQVGEKTFHLARFVKNT